jgi:hypothetical protein
MELGKADVRRVKLTGLNPAPYNPRLIRDEAFEGLSGSIDRFGLLSLIIWNERTGNIVGGHQRYRKLVRDGETETDVVVVDLDDDAEVALNIALNSPHIRGDFTKEVVALLEKVEVQIGSAFNEVGLADLHNYIKRLKFDKDGPGDGPGDGPEPGDGDPPPNEGDSAVISCPRCGSLWRMADNKVIFNAIEEAKKDGDEVDGEDGEAG